LTELDELKRRVSEVRWFHSIDLGQGIVTPGRDRSASKLRTLRFPERMDGRTVLDIGAFDGFFAFEAERRGAKRVVAVDSIVWNSPDYGKAGFELAREALGSSVVDHESEVADLRPEDIGTFDIVLFLGVLYHLRDPLGALTAVASVCADQLILETFVDLLGCGRPAAAFYPHDELGGDPSNWWGPNVPAVEGMLKAVGFTTVNVVSVTPWPSRLARAVKDRACGRPFRQTLQRGRLVVHAFR
jgi:tRNA (mo5U34)-methyltransferase